MFRFVRRNPLLAAVWLLALLPGLYLSVWPLAMNAWAQRTWRREACLVSPWGDHEERYMYIIDGVQYISLKRDFWDLESQGSMRNRKVFPYEGKESTCYVNPRKLEDAVLYLDAPAHLSKGLRGLIFSGVMAGVAATITVLQRRRALARQRQAAAAQNPGENAAADRAGGA